MQDLKHDKSDKPSEALDSSSLMHLVSVGGVVDSKDTVKSPALVRVSQRKGCFS